MPKDAPFCAAPNTRPIFVAPMGQVFRAAPGEPYPAAQWIAEADADHDGAVDRAEMVADARRFFGTIDHDHDGRLTPEEVTAYERDVAPEIALYAARREPGGRDGYGVPLGAGRYAWLNIPEPVASADADIDRIVTVGEFADAAGRRFDALDLGATGRLTATKLPRTPQQIALQGPCRPPPKRDERQHWPFVDAAPDPSQQEAHHE